MNVVESRILSSAVYSTIGLLALFALVSFAFFPVDSLWVDETSSLFFASQPWPTFWSTLWLSEGNMSLYYLVLKLYLYLGLNSEFMLRLPSAVFALIGVFWIYRFVRKQVGPNHAFAVAALIIVNPMFIKYAWEARSYSMVFMFAAFAIPMFWNAVRSGSMHYFVGFGLLAGLSLYSHIFLLLLYGALGLYLLLNLIQKENRTARFKGGLLAYILMVLVALPILAFFGLQANNAPNVNWIEPTGLSVVFEFYVDQITGRYTYDWYARTAALVILFLLGACAAYAVFLLWGYSGPNSRPHHPALQLARYRMMLCFCAGLPVVILAIAAKVKPLFVDRYLIFTLAAFAPLVVTLLSMLPRRLGQGLYVLLFAMGLLGLHNQAGRPQFEFRDLYTKLAQHCAQGDSVLFPNPSVYTTFVYYQARIEGLADCKLKQQPTILTVDNFYRRVLIEEVQWPSADSDKNLWVVYSSVGSPLHSITGLLHEKVRHEHGVTLIHDSSFPLRTNLLGLHARPTEAVEAKQ
ncbi:glycosyltransferase family 39 protein [Allohahella marinimesophila]|uniref:Glycosyltransferase family 39 protein n=1 Tax=Allohahella marinimesophila TaxID=1054972 RepID=A0ABP7QAH5_9GAMM